MGKLRTWLPGILIAAAVAFVVIGVRVLVTGGGQDAGGTVAIGGPFTLVDQDGRTVTQADFKGRHMLVYFGYTFCPDVCPTELQTMSDALERLGKTAETVVPVFVTVDPGRDTPQVMKDYVRHFHPRLVGLTGSPDQTAAAAKAFKVYFAKVEGKDGAPYLMDHSSIVYLMGPDGRFLGHFGHGTTPEAMAEGIKRKL